MVFEFLHDTPSIGRPWWVGLFSRRRTRNRRFYGILLNVYRKLCNFSGCIASIYLGRVLRLYQNGTAASLQRSGTAVSVSPCLLSQTAKGILVRDNILCHHPPPKGRYLSGRPFFYCPCLRNREKVSNGLDCPLAGDYHI